MKRIVILAVTVVCFGGTIFAAPNQERLLEINLSQEITKQQAGITGITYYNFDEIFAATDAVDSNATKEIKKFFNTSYSKATIFNVGTIGEKKFLSTLNAGKEYKMFYISVFHVTTDKGPMMTYYSLSLTRLQGWPEGQYILGAITPLLERQVVQSSYEPEDMQIDQQCLWRLRSQLEALKLPVNTLQTLAKSFVLSDIMRISLLEKLHATEAKSKIRDFKLQILTVHNSLFEQAFKYYPVDYKYNQNPYRDVEFHFLGEPIVTSADDTTFLN